MLVKKAALFIIVIFLISTESFAQKIIKGKEIKKATVNFSELARYYQLHPEPLLKKPLFNESDEDEERPIHKTAIGDKVHIYYKDAKENRSHSSMRSLSAAPVDTFLSTGSNNTGFPPDTHGAVDSQYCVTTINQGVHIQTRTGVNVSNISLDQFWTPLLTSGPGSFDPRVHYDPYYKRWIMICDAYGEVATSQIMIAVSATSNPTGVWNMYAVRIDATGASWMDFPCIGYNKKWIVVTGNMFPITGGGVYGAVTYVFDYAAIMAGTGAPYTRFYDGGAFTICPVQTYDSTEPNLYSIETGNSGAGQLILRKISGTTSSPTISLVGYPSSTTSWNGGAGGSNFLPQVGTTNLINQGDDRITSAIYRDHHIWCAHTVFLPYGSPSRSSLMWWEIDTLANPVQNGLIDDPSNTNYFAYPSIAVNKNEDVLVGYGIFNTSIHPSCGYSLHLATDPIDAMESPRIYRHGQATYYTTGGTADNRNRWGDYSATCIDPRNDTDFWTIQESSTPGTSSNFDTWWAKIQECPKPTSPVLTSTPNPPCLGDTAAYYYKINPIPGAIYYVWSENGATFKSPNNLDSIKISVDSSIAHISVVAYNACGEGEGLDFTITHNAPPSATTISTFTPPCIGAPNAVYSGIATNATSYNWVAIGTGWAGTSTATSLTATFGTDTGKIICTAINYCGSGPSDTLIQVPGIVPSSSFTIANHLSNIITGDTITFTGSAPSGSVFSWYFGGGSATPGTGVGPQVVYWSIPGLKTVNLTISYNGCTSIVFSDTVRVIIKTDVEHVTAPDNHLHILPNPNDGRFEMLFDEHVTEPISIKIIDNEGRVVYEKENIIIPDNKLSIELQHLPNGVYTVSVSIGNNTIKQQFNVLK